MPTFAPPTNVFEAAPAGLHPAVCVDFVDEGFKPTRFGDKHKVRYVFQIGERNSQGKRFLVSAWFNLSMHENASLRAFLSQWRGRPITDDEVNKAPGIDLESLVGKPCTLNVAQNAMDGKTYANIIGITKHDARLGEPLQPEGYTRVQDREDAQAQAAPAAQTPASDEWDDANPIF